MQEKVLFQANTIRGEQELLRRQNERLLLLADTAAHLLATDDPQAQIQGLYEKVAEHLGVDTYFNFMVDTTENALALDFCGGVPAQRLPSLQRLEFGQAICGTVAQTRQAMHACDIQNSNYDKAALVRSMGIRVYCCHPLMAGDRLLGTLSFASHTRDRFDEDEVEFMRTICHYVAMAKERARLLREAREEGRRRGQTEARFRLLFEHSNDGILIADDAGGYIQANAAASKILGYPPDQLTAMRVSDLISVQTPSAAERYAAYLDRGYETGEFSFLRPDGEERVIEYSATRIGPDLHLSIIRDVTERRSMEEALRESSNRIRLIADNAPAYISNVDTHYRFVFVNRASAERFGMRPDEVVGKTVEEVVGKEALDLVRPYMERAFQGETFSYEAAVPYEQLGTLYMQVCYAPDLAEDGTVRGLVAVAHDITARKRMEEERDRHAAEIERLNNRLRQAIQETHHRVKNNLQILAAMVDLQTMEGRSMLPASEFARLSQHIRALAAVHDVLTMNEEKTEAVSVRVILEKLLPMLQHTVGERRLRYTLDNAKLPIRQVSSLALCTNELISNAVKHGHGEVRLAFTVQNGSATLEVSDNGPGFPSGFDPDTAANTGLQLIRNLAAWDLGGTADFDNGEQGGARVTITMPLVFPAPRETAPPK